jgi:hypothetical protein
MKVKILSVLIILLLINVANAKMINLGKYDSSNKSENKGEYYLNKNAIFNELNNGD